MSEPVTVVLGSTDEVAALVPGSAVLAWAELLGSSADEMGDDVPAVLVDLTTVAGRHRAPVPAAAGPHPLVVAMAEAERTHGPGVVLVAAGPVTDTLKLVDAAGRVVGTADREAHRLVTGPLVTRLGSLRAAARSLAAPASPRPTSVTPAPSTPAPSTPAPSTPAPSTPAPSTPAPATVLSVLVAAGVVAVSSG